MKDILRSILNDAEKITPENKEKMLSFIVDGKSPEEKISLDMLKILSPDGYEEYFSYFGSSHYLVEGISSCLPVEFLGFSTLKHGVNSDIIESVSAFLAGQHNYDKRMFLNDIERISSILGSPVDHSSIHDFFNTESFRRFSLSPKAPLNISPELENKLKKGNCSVIGFLQKSLDSINSEYLKSSTLNVSNKDKIKSSLSEEPEKVVPQNSMRL